MNLKSLSNEVLMASARTERKVERESTTAMLRYMMEIDARKLYLEGAGTLCSFVMDEFGYTINEAMPRIRAMELMREVPALEKQIDDGTMSVSVASKAQTYFRVAAKEQRPVSKSAKAAIMTELTGNSLAKAEKTLATHFPETEIQADKIKATSADGYEYKFLADNELHEKFEHLKDILAHQNCSREMNKFLHQLADIALEKLEPKVADVYVGSEKLKKADLKTTSGVNCSLFSKIVNNSKSSDGELSKCGKSQPQPSANQTKASRYVSRSVQNRMIRTRRQGCAHVDSRTGKRCGRTHGVERDHMEEFFLGGKSDIENFQWLCGPHNRWKHAKITEEMRQAGFGML